MAAPVRSSGSKIVVVAVTATLGMVGFGSIYLPFFADRDKLRGMHEEKDAPTGALLAQEIQKFRREGSPNPVESPTANMGDTAEVHEKGNSSGSMWKNMKRS